MDQVAKKCMNVGHLLVVAVVGSEIKEQERKRFDKFVKPHELSEKRHRRWEFNFLAGFCMFLWIQKWNVFTQTGKIKTSSFMYTQEQETLFFFFVTQSFKLVSGIH